MRLFPSERELARRHWRYFGRPYLTIVGIAALIGLMFGAEDYATAYQDYLTDFSTFFLTNTVGTALLYEIIIGSQGPGVSMR